MATSAEGKKEVIDPVRIGDAELYCGDVLSVLAGLPEESVHCVVTSPPYWGLRDYGTGQWEGGNAECDHKESTARHDGGRVQIDGFHGSAASDSDKGAMNYRTICAKCGARRIDAQIGLESTPEEYVAKMVEVFRAVRRVLRKDGTLWLNLGDSYATSGTRAGNRDGNLVKETQEHRHYYQKLAVGLKEKDLCGIPWRVAFALQADGWYLRSDIIWAKPNPMPESVTDRPTKAHEYLFLLSRSPKYFYDAEAIREPHLPASIERASRPWHGEAVRNHPSGNPQLVSAGRAEGAPMDTCPLGGRNRRTVWTIATEPYPEAHFATFPRKLVQPCILAGCPEHACPKCGAPWVKEVEKTDERVGEDRGGNRGGIPRTDGTKVMLGGYKPGSHYVTVDHGEHPTCTCGLPAIGGTCLDPFGGSGTTAEVALEYGRRAILIELKPEYVELQKRRLAPVAGRPLLDFTEDRGETVQLELETK
jgi:DNA modification methylase